MIRDAGIAFETPERAVLPDRLEAVLESIYAAYGLGWDNIDGADAKIAGFSEEALFLGTLLVSLLPDSAEARGLRALMLYCEARAPARRDDQGRFVPFSDQNPNLWTRAMVIEAEQELTRAAQLITGDPAALGRFQIEAAMQSVHIQRAVTGRTNWPVVIALYETLMLRAPSIGAWVGRAAAVGEAGNPEAGLLQLDQLPTPEIQSYQPFWAVRADLLAKLGQQEEARAAYARAIGLSQSPAIKNYLTERMARPQQNASP